MTLMRSEVVGRGQDLTDFRKERTAKALKCLAEESRHHSLYSLVERIADEG